MKTTELLALLMKGEIVAVGELLQMNDAKEFPSKDKNGNAIAGKFNVRGSAQVLLGTQSVEVGDFLKVARAADAPKAPEWAKPRVRVVCRLRSYQNTKFGVRADGEISLLEG